MIESLSSRCKVEECSFNTIFGTFQGHRIFASRKVAEKIEVQTRYAAELYNVDVRQDKRYWPRKTPFLWSEASLSSLSSLRSIEQPGDPSAGRSSCIRVPMAIKESLRARRRLFSDLLLEFNQSP